MQNEITKDQYHEMLMVMLAGSDNYDMFVRTSSLVFPSITAEQRKFYFSSFHAMKAVEKLLTGSAISLEDFNRLMKEAGDHILKDTPSPYPDNVTPIKH